MNRHEFRINRYRAISSASIVNDGITIIAGENGSGKSTLSRLVYCLINSMSTFDFDVADSAKSELGRLLHGVHRTILQLYAKNAETRNKIIDIWEKFNEQDLYIDDLALAFEQVLDIYDYYLTSALLNETDSRKRQRFMSFLDVTLNNIQSPELALSEFLSKIRNEKDKIISEAQNSINKNLIGTLVELVQNNGLGFYDLTRKNFSIFENDVELTKNKTFLLPLKLNRAIYIDTPMAVTDYSIGNTAWDKLSTMLLEESVQLTMEGKKLKRRIQNIMRGDIHVKDFGFADIKELYYKRHDGLDIRLEGAATGIKAFAYLEMLLDNGFLTNDTILIIDEPEAHLHPQWIFEFARILVLLHKEIGVKIMIASHNPDMVAAIRAITEKEGLLSSTRFYLAEREHDNSYNYIYRDLATDIAPIFASFNIALERIKLYGAE